MLLFKNKIAIREAEHSAVHIPKIYPELPTTD